MTTLHNYYYESSDNDYISEHSDDEYMAHNTSSLIEKNMEICTEPNALYLTKSNTSLEDICENKFSPRIDESNYMLGMVH